jgi:hypothetical protein
VGAEPVVDEVDVVLAPPDRLQAVLVARRPVERKALAGLLEKIAGQHVVVLVVLDEEDAHR